MRINTLIIKGGRFMSKKILAVLTVIFILTLSLSAAVSADEVVYVSVDLLNIRISA